MAWYSKIERRILTDQKFNGLSKDGKLVFFILLVHPHLIAIGALRGTLAGLASVMRWPYEDFQQSFAQVLQKGRVKYDEVASLIGLPKYLDHNQPESPKVVKSWGQCLDELSECRLKRRSSNKHEPLLKGYRQAFGKPCRKPSPSLFTKPTSVAPQKEVEKIALTHVSLNIA